MSKHKKYIVSEKYSAELKTAGVLTVDNECFLNSIGFSSIELGVFTKNSVIAKIIRVCRVIKYAIICSPKSIVVFHFPLRTTAFTWLQKILKWKGCISVAIIVDIDGFRDNDNALLQYEMDLLAKFNFIIAHNETMCLMLKKYIANVPLLSICLFDYAANNKKSNKQLTNIVCIAANFKKAAFINGLHTIPQIQFNLYGSKLDKGLFNEHKNINYKGSFNHIDLVDKLEGSFGLVWDGDSIETCSAYYQINNPHKLSLYIAAGLPLIVWYKCPFATTVVEQGLGFAINSLAEIYTIISKTTTQNYQQMVDNVEKYRLEVVDGFFIKKVITTILQSQHK